MNKVFVLFRYIEDELQLLTRVSTKGHELPTQCELDVSPLSSRKEVNAFYSVVSGYQCESFSYKPIFSIDQFVPSLGAIVCEALGELFPLFKETGFKLPSLLIKNTFNYEQGTFFGGSFNPWHEGHDECLRKSSSLNIIIVPDRNPWKEEQGHSCYFKSLKELLLKFENTPYSIYPGFYGLEHANPTVSWIGKTLIKEKGLLMGDDNFCQIFKWKNAPRLLELISSIEVLNRNHGLEDIRLIESKILKDHKNLSINLLGDHPHMDISSTNLRKSNK